MFQELRYAARSLKGAPAFAATAVVTLALAIAVNTIVFTLLNSLALRPMPVRDGASVVRVFPVDADGRRHNLFSHPDYRDLKEAAQGLVGVAAYSPIEVTATEGEGVREALAYVVSASYFPLLGIQPSRGRSFSEQEEGDPAARVVVISDAIWRRGFAGAENILGRTATINGQSFTIVGVGPATFMGTEPLEADFWVPLAAQRIIQTRVDRLDDRTSGWLLMVGRLASGVRARSVEESLSAMASRLAADAPGARRHLHAVAVVRATFFHAGPELRPVIALVFGIVALVLVIACANIANLVLTRAAARRRDLAVRVALGATTWRLARHLMAESLLIAAAGAIVALLLCAWTVRVLYPVGLSLLPFRWARVVLDLTPDLRVFAYTMALAAVASAAFGLAPLFQSSARALAAGLRDQTSVFGLHVRGPRIRRGLVVVQIAVCLMLLTVAALAARGLHHSRTLDLGFAADGVVHTSADLVRHGYTQAAATELYARLIARVTSLPGVLNVALTTHVPLTGGVRLVPVSVEGQDASERIACTYRGVSPGYFRTLRIPIVAGRDFSEDEARTTAPVAIISDGLARRFWPGEIALGRRVTLENGAVPVTIIGIARDAADIAIWREKQLSIYLPVTTASIRNLSLLVRTEGDATRVAALLRAEAQRIDPGLRFDAAPLNDVLALWILPSRVAAVAASILGAIALAIAAVGIYGVMAYVVSQRRREIGIRIALGATDRDVRGLLFADGGRLIGIGVAAGVAGASALTRAFAAALPTPGSVDPVALGAASLVLTLAALAASYLPARSAAKTDPVVALRSE